MELPINGNSIILYFGRKLYIFIGINCMWDVAWYLSFREQIVFRTQVFQLGRGI